MGTIVLLITLIAEIAFTAYRIITKSNQDRFRNYIRVGAFVAFILFTLVSVIRWNGTWYLFALLLFIWALVGTLELARNKSETKEYKPGSSVSRAVTTMLLIFIALIPALIFPQHRSPKITGPHPAATVNYTYVDESHIDPLANKGESVKVNAGFWYPNDGGGPYPLVIFSHGILGTKASNTSTYMELASNGYLQEYMNVSKGMYDEETSIQLEQKWIGWRVADINFVLDTIITKTKEAGSGAVYQMIDPEKIGLMSHSLGGESSAQVARERSDISAVINLDADLADEYMECVNDKWTLNDKSYPVPLLNIFSDALENLMSTVPNENEVIAVKHIIAIDPQAYEVHLAGTNHMSLTDPLISPLLVNVINASVPKAGGRAVDPLATNEKMNDLIQKFFNTYLKVEGNFTTA